MRITELFANGEFVVTAEVGPPKGIHVDHLVEEAKTYLSGITAVNVTDNQSSVMRMGSLPACVALHNAGLTPILQLTCRDRNRIALQSELLVLQCWALRISSASPATTPRWVTIPVQSLCSIWTPSLCCTPSASWRRA